MHAVDIPVLIIGGGGCGLSASIFLSNLGVDHLLVERHDTTSHLPKAHYLNQRTLEMYRQHGIDEAIYEVGAPLDRFGKIRWVTSIGGDRSFERQLIHEMDAFGGGALKERYAVDSPSEASNYPQLRLEPLLREQAEKRAPGMIRFGHTVTGWIQRDEGVEVSVTDGANGEQYTINARYVIAADGGKTVGPVVGVEMVGPTNMVDMVSVHFSADLSEYVDDDTLIHWFLNPEGESSWDAGAMVKMGPTWDRHSEEWVIHFMFRPDDPQQFDEDAVSPRVRELLKLPKLELKVHKVSHWILDRIVARQWRFGDILLAGDAAHRQPPTSGLGLNTGIGDAHALAWRLAAVLDGSAGDSLLDTYEQERIPVCTDGADWALLAFSNHSLIDAAIGLAPGATVAQNVEAFEILLSDSRLGRAIRNRTEKAIGTQVFEFQAHDVEIGYSYPEGSLVDDGSGPVPRSEDGTNYTPTTQPGRRLPHAWVEREGQRVSTHDLLGPTWQMTLIANGERELWEAAGRTVSESTGVPLQVAVIGGDGNIADPNGTWAGVSELQPGGALLVRPDQHIAWRTVTRPDEAEQALNEALERVLHRT